MTVEYTICTDESIDKGRFCSNFFGGVLYRTSHEDAIIHALTEAKAAQNMFQEIKWSKVSEAYLEKYMAVMDAFFDLVHNRSLKVRIMFTRNHNVPIGLEKHHFREQYSILYYQFIKHAFGLRYCNPDGRLPIQLRILLDIMPEKLETVQAFKKHLVSLNNEERFRANLITTPYEAIQEIDSKDHVVLQCLDVVLGAMQFRLNDKHKDKPQGAYFRAKKTIAKEKLYKHINAKIREGYSNFNVGMSTSDHGDLRNRWLHPYSHWCFAPTNSKLDHSLGKHAKRTF